MTKTTMRVVLWDSHPDADDVPNLDGLIDLTEEEARDLTARLDRLEREDIIGSYEMYAYESPDPVALTGIYIFATGDVEMNDPSLLGLWNGEGES